MGRGLFALQVNLEDSDDLRIIATICEIIVQGEDAGIINPNDVVRSVSWLVERLDNWLMANLQYFGDKDKSEYLEMLKWIENASGQRIKYLSHSNPTT